MTTMSTSEKTKGKDASKNMQTLGKNLSVGSIVRLSGLNSAKGQKMNGSVAEIVGDHREGRFDIKMIESDADIDIGSGTRIKTMNMRIVCSYCFKDKKKFQYCVLCKCACYCNKECQANHWRQTGPRQHKLHCTGKKAAAASSAAGTGQPKPRAADDDDDKGYENLYTAWKDKLPEELTWKKSMDHPSWVNLTQPTRHALRKLHERSGCVVPWPVCCETPAMLDDLPSFLINHPNMKFEIIMISIPGVSQLPMLREKTPFAHPSEVRSERFMYGGYFEKVPFHHAIPVRYAIIGEVVWTKHDYADFENYFNDPMRKGALFEWPGAEAVGICPGTGKRVKYSYTKKHLLVVCNMYGQAIRGSSFNVLSRLMPRILTIDGYYKMLGPDKRDRCVPAKVKHGQGSWETSQEEFYPKQLEFVNSTVRGRGYPSTDANGAPMFASAAYSRYHASGEYTKYERYMENKNPTDFAFP
mmetsp:Transcript_27826/g.34365  ORF Transcript_27826/g.34365 Transcript_27826/m.34365 type:complete len:470 (+) Transcript_27826:123-1532(+)